MASEDVETMRAGFERLRTDGFEPLLELVHPEFEMTTNPGQAAEPQTYRGAAGMRRWWESFYEVMDSVEIDAQDLHDAGGGAVIVETVLRARGQSSGLEVSQPTCMLIRMDEGLMRSIEFYDSVAEARAAAAPS